MIEHTRIFVDGEWIASAGRPRLLVTNPVTEAVIAAVPEGTAEDVDLAAHAAARAFPAWSRTPIEERVRMFRKLANLTEQSSEDITRFVVEELGYPVSWASKSQTEGAVEELRIIAESLGEIRWSEQVENTLVQRVPSGVLGAITAWNAPLRSVISKAGAAMAAGCTVVLKPSEIAPLTAFLFADLVAAAGFPKGVFNLVCGTGKEVGSAIASHPLIDMVSLTGSVQAGRSVMNAGSQTIKRMHLELGGKSANVILEDADFARAVVDGIEDAMRNAGQVCGGLTRMLVPSARLAEAEALAVQRAEQFVLGDPWRPETTLGPVVSESQRSRVLRYIDSAMVEGVRLLTGGVDTPDGLEKGYFVRPTVFSGDNRSEIAREEIFGPVVVIIPFENESEAIGIANDSPYGLAAGVWSGDEHRARSVAGALRVGRVRINGAPLNKRGTHGGFKLSGVGREWGRFGIEEFLERKSVIG